MRSWLETSWFEYLLTRPVLLRHFNIVVLVVGIVYAVFITLFNVIAVGYDSNPKMESSYNTSLRLWYSFLPESALTPLGKTCEPSTVKISEGFALMSITTNE
jgi:hypothetical protein